MKLFLDKELTNPVNNVDLGIVMAGETKEFTFYVLNESKAELQNINFETSHKEVDIIHSPKDLKSLESAKLVMAWSPSVTLKQGLKTVLKVQATELWS